MAIRRILAPHPGETLLEDFMKPLGLTVATLATECGLDSATIGGIIDGASGITPYVAAALERRFGASAAFWLNLQLGYERRTAKG